MNSVVNLVKENRFFFSFNLLLAVIFGLYLCCISRVEGFMMMNSFHNEFLQSFFNLATCIGDGWFTMGISLLLFVFFKKHRQLAFVLLMAYLSSGIFAQLFKALIQAPRPSLYFKLHHYRYFLDTFANSRAGYTSFPSGHSASVFALLTVLSIYGKRKYLCTLLLVVGVLAGYSRIYLAHHFLIDVFAGAIIGLLFGSWSYVWTAAKWGAIVKWFSQNRESNSKQQSTNFPSLD